LLVGIWTGVPDSECPYFDCPDFVCPDFDCPDFDCPDFDCAIHASISGSNHGHGTSAWRLVTVEIVTVQIVTDFDCPAFVGTPMSSQEAQLPQRSRDASCY